jgi:putative ABC transport system permease protein
LNPTAAIRVFLGNLRLAFFLAFKSLWKGNRWAALLIISVMALSYAQLILTPSIISGVTHALNAQQINTLYGNVIVDPRTGDYYLEHQAQMQASLEQQPGVTAATAHLTSSALIEYHWQDRTDPSLKGDEGHWPVIGIAPENESRVTTISTSLISGSYLAPDDLDQIVLGIEIAGGPQAAGASFLNLGGVSVGERVRLTYPNGIQQEYTVKGIFKARDGQADRQAFVSYQELVRVMGTQYADRASQILIKTDPLVKEAVLAASLRAGGIAGEVRTWQAYGGGIGGVVASFNVSTSLISAIGLVVAAIVMFIVIYISVINKKRQIGILRAIGVNRFAIYVSYLCQALFYAILGIIIGGLLFGYVIQPYFAAHPLDLSIGRVSLAIDPSTIRNSVIGIMVAAVFAGIMPVVNITRHSIIKAIWGS